MSWQDPSASHTPPGVTEKGLGGKGRAVAGAMMSLGRRTLFRENPVCRSRPTQLGRSPPLPADLPAHPKLPGPGQQRILSDQPGEEVQEEEPSGGGTATPAWSTPREQQANATKERKTRQLKAAAQWVLESLGKRGQHSQAAGSLFVIR